MMNIGVRPTVDGHKKVIEVNIFEFDEDIYEQTLTVMVYDYIRGEVKFNGLDALKAQLNEDVKSAKVILNARPLS
jgi:riboflavin kinase/FMN adenylyltransferase